MNVKLIVLMVCIGVQSFVAKAEYRKFKDANGRMIEAEVLRYDAMSKKVSLNCKGKGSKTVPISIFSEADQKYIVSWSSNQDFLSDRKLKVKFSRNKDKNKNRSREYDGMSTKYYDCSYKITIENGSTTDFNDVILEYVIYYTQDKHINNRRDTEELNGTLYAKKTISLPKKSSKDIVTDKVALLEYREGGFSENWPDVKSDIDGIILNLSMKSETGETISRRIKFPDKLLFTWTTQTKDVQQK